MSFKESLSRGFTSLNVKASNFMEENKINTYKATLTMEIKELKEYIGDSIYKQWLNGDISIETIIPVFEKIREKNAEIEIQNAKIEQLRKEEEQIFGVKTQFELICPKCSTKNEGGNLFCTKCGTPLS